MKKMKLNQNKKAILPATILKMIIAVLCIVGLLMLAVKLYTMFTYKTEIEQARESLNQITAQINGLKEGEKSSFLITSPEGWVLVSFGNKICICSHDFSYNPSFSESNLEKDCKENGVCENARKEVKINEVCSLNEQGSESAGNCFKIELTSIILSEEPNEFVIRRESSGFISALLEKQINLTYSEGDIEVTEQIGLKEGLQSYIKGDSKVSFNNEPNFIKAVWDLLQKESRCDGDYAFVLLEGSDEKGIRRLGIKKSTKIEGYLNSPYSSPFIDLDLLKRNYYPYIYTSFNVLDKNGKEKVYTAGYTTLKTCPSLS